MEHKNTALLNAIVEAMAAYRSGALTVGELADQLLVLRDHLEQGDNAWLRAFTQQVITLASASTFVPKDDVQARQVSRAREVAVDAISRLVNDRLGASHRIGDREV